jgi:hypothetical protein
MIFATYYQCPTVSRPDFSQGRCPASIQDSGLFTMPVFCLSSIQATSDPVPPAAAALFSAGRNSDTTFGGKYFGLKRLARHQSFDVDSCVVNRQHIGYTRLARELSAFHNRFHQEFFQLVQPIRHPVFSYAPQTHYKLTANIFLKFPQS